MKRRYANGAAQPFLNGADTAITLCREQAAMALIPRRRVVWSFAPRGWCAAARGYFDARGSCRASAEASDVTVTPDQKPPGGPGAERPPGVENAGPDAPESHAEAPTPNPRPTAKEARAARLAAELRANLKRRKAPQRRRSPVDAAVAAPERPDDAAKMPPGTAAPVSTCKDH